MSKHISELAFWVNYFANPSSQSDNGMYKQIMLSILGSPDASVLDSKIVADFGCGPLGCLSWATNASMRIGIDVLAATYLTHFGDQMKAHSMVYVTSTEKIVPLPDNSVDVLFTINSLDHVEHLEIMAAELLRVIKPGGIFAGSFNLHEPACLTEPQTLDLPLLRKLFFRHLNMKICTFGLKGEMRNGKAYTYENMLSGKFIPAPGPDQPCILWASGIKS